MGKFLVCDITVIGFVVAWQASAKGKPFDAAPFHCVGLDDTLFLKGNGYYDCGGRGSTGRKLSSEDNSDADAGSSREEEESLDLENVPKSQNIAAMFQRANAAADGPTPTAVTLTTTVIGLRSQRLAERQGQTSSLKRDFHTFLRDEEGQDDAADADWKPGDDSQDDGWSEDRRPSRKASSSSVQKEHVIDARPNPENLVTQEKIDEFFAAAKRTNVTTAGGGEALIQAFSGFVTIPVSSLVCLVAGGGAVATVWWFLMGASISGREPLLEGP
eukprot:gnl/TRDRNA2_/TRDRNA2_185749_c0_seq1.p1 gnl/TRDRNA2_/TRDRNA2_185749_c0~~gnl/TRDRNA2_/TRDRNA2_185749_c0_seq1.p1  ORF type:complete len:273 (+),score=44.37 gnl/TRDRNA2_/TRDRNA2_185749_c0_seq1:130-948(+)